MLSNVESTLMVALMHFPFANTETINIFHKSFSVGVWGEL